jgi:hypothetical protein
MESSAAAAWSMMDILGQVASDELERVVAGADETQTSVTSSGVFICSLVQPLIIILLCVFPLFYL